jgi:peptidylprolyl isomerase
MHDGQQTVPVIIREVEDAHVLLDANHPLAGQELNFDLEIVNITEGGKTAVDFEEIA